MDSIKRCWCSCFSERVMSHRLEVGAAITDLRMAVIVQVSSCPLSILQCTALMSSGNGGLLCEWCSILTSSTHADIV